MMMFAEGEEMLRPQCTGVSVLAEAVVDGKDVKES
jgi:hypothetical protein